ncbi:MAG: alpha/beta-hydrolase family protein [Sphingomonadales bacterium]|nr:alpha/beta-hydrolase family protein [Sphingomonadales bacterium]
MARHTGRKAPEADPFGLSLGALNSEQSFDFHDIVGDPLAARFGWGPPFASPVWNEITRTRAKNSPAWLPIFRDSSLFRFQNQNGSLQPAEASWGLCVLSICNTLRTLSFFLIPKACGETGMAQQPKRP